MAIKLTERAADEVRRFRTEHEFNVESFLRIGVAGGGCSVVAVARRHHQHCRGYDVPYFHERSIPATARGNAW